MTRSYLGAFALLSLLLAGPRAAHGAESYDNCTGFITSVPTVITTSGTWCLKKDLTTAMTSGVAITIETNNVIIDCNDFKLGGLAAGVGTQAGGIGAQHRQNVTVRHCNIRGFFNGINVGGCSAHVGCGGGHVIEDNRFDGNTYIGIVIEGDGSVVRRNRIFDTGGTTAYPGSPDTAGILAIYSVDILDNTVSGVTATVGGGYDARGIFTLYNDGSVSGNRVRDVLPDGFGTATGIDNFLSGRVSMRNNDLVGGGAGSIGLECSAVGIAKDNVINGFELGLDCSDGGGNVIAP